jgi:hypothetical protein
MIMDARNTTHGHERRRFSTSITGRNGVASRRELAVLTDSDSAVRVSLDVAGTRSQLVVEDLDSGEQIALGSTELFQLIVEAEADDAWSVWRR